MLRTESQYQYRMRESDGVWMVERLLNSFLNPNQINQYISYPAGWTHWNSFPSMEAAKAAIDKDKQGTTYYYY